MTSDLDAIIPQVADVPDASSNDDAARSSPEFHQIACDLPLHICVSRDEVALVTAFLGDAIHQILNSEPELKILQLPCSANGRLQPGHPTSVNKNGANYNDQHP